MAKSKNHTNHNQGHKDHANGIKRIPRQRYGSQRLVNQKLARNIRRSKKFDPSIKKSVNYTRKVLRLKEQKAKIIELIRSRRIAKLTKPKATSAPAQKAAAPVNQRKPK